MLRNTLPFKVSIVSVPTNLVDKLFSSYNTHQDYKLKTDKEIVSYTKKMSIDSIPTKLHLRIIPFREQDSKKRLRAYQGSMGILYLFEKRDLVSFEEIVKDFLKFKDFYNSMNSNPIFLGLNSHSNQEGMDKIDQEVEKYELKYKEVNITETNSFEHFLRKFILNSESFQATVQGS
ncbi:MAG: hypothetical protein ACXAC6_06510 [Candidatus Hodarchaeales archaeon]|jgi:hypothetical protein